MAKLEVVENQAAYVLHSRPFRDSSLLVHLLSKDHGRVNVIAKGARKQSGKRQARQPLQALLALQVDWQGRSDLKTLLRWESRSQPLMLQGDRLYSALYINELLMRLLPENDSAAELFEPYETCMKALDSNCDLQPLLRCFELNLLTALGYGLDFEHSEGDAPIHSDGYYYWQTSGLFIPAGNRNNAYRGEHLMAIEQRDFSDSAVLLCAKQLMRQVFDHLLDHKPLKTREFVRQMQQQSVGVSKHD
ncbi:DNA repair protein RecO [Pseudoteredinibacter isoporae]|uniref:DNA repair protein RecO n=1 Tax=Pseudoteredinibacter isoporae TaxID=570281 RepID=A0A7X0JYQ2_9GAMM|nr:DNA repair protein RecO [Pseudoteredinibacter isoporae]MBB6523716.1 DNA repair protein RecO (recombination protein O) [Pseudoteredinibacter isoporae]NHO89219.1 DNA repair protein RecO [Pseudoteredinibacter isoporae]NIB22170.1 DNA repair protein RecO [Pseudoteredinibacter isoporae]